MKTEQIQELITKISKSNFNSSDVAVLFIFLRQVFSQDPILLDIANFIAHSEGRTRGESFDSTYRYVDQFILVSKQGGSIKGLSPVFKREDVINRLIRVIKKNNFNLDEKEFHTQKDSIINQMHYLMKETELKLPQPEVVKCYLKRLGNKMKLCLHLNLKEAFIIISPSACIQIDLFD